MPNLLIESFRKFLITRQSDQIEDKVKDFSDFISGNYKKDIIYDEIVDYYDIVKGEYTRWQSFARYIETRFPKETYPRVLDVGCGPLADLSLSLNEKGYGVTGIDPRVNQINQLKTIRQSFNYLKTDISSYDLIVGLEPCEATEHIIRSSIQSNVPCAIKLCAKAHDSMNGQQFLNKEDWYNYLLSLSNTKGIIEEKKILNKPNIILKIK